MMRTGEPTQTVLIGLGETAAKGCAS